jgi:hypothetical protein
LTWIFDCASELEQVNVKLHMHINLYFFELGFAIKLSRVAAEHPEYQPGDQELYLLNRILEKAYYVRKERETLKWSLTHRGENVSRASKAGRGGMARPTGEDRLSHHK